MGEETNIATNTSTEAKIKEAARKVFTQKGFAATRTRDIAEEAGFNLALLNYYFKSKQKLFVIIMLENMQLFIQNFLKMVHDPGTTFQNKIEVAIGYYIDMLIKNPDLPIFVLSELRADPNQFVSKVGISQIPASPILIAQWKDFVMHNKIRDTNPIHFAINLISLTIFPFIGSPLIRNRTGLGLEEFNHLMEERKKLIPKWIEMMMMEK